MKKVFNKFLCVQIMVSFLALNLAPRASASAENIPANLNAGITEAINAPNIRGILIHPENPFKINFLISQGDLKDDNKFKEESMKLVKYFLTSLTLPEEQMWVNLSPYEKNRIVPDKLGETIMGKDLLELDLLLKQISASKMSVKDSLGKIFWQRVYQKAKKDFNATDIPLNMYNKIWIVPEGAQIFETQNGAYVVNSSLDVLTEEDYLAMKKNKIDAKTNAGTPMQEIIKQILIPEIKKEINESSSFAKLRQIYSALILANWYKTTLKKSIINQVYSNKQKINGVASDDKKAIEKIYNSYVTAFQKGAYDYIKEEYNPDSREIVVRKYLSGGVGLDKTSRKTTKSFKLGRNDLATKNVEVDLLGMNQTQAKKISFKADQRQVNSIRQMIERVLVEPKSDYMILLQNGLKVEFLSQLLDGEERLKVVLKISDEQDKPLKKLARILSKYNLAFISGKHNYIFRFEIIDGIAIFEKVIEPRNYTMRLFTNEQLGQYERENNQDYVKAYNEVLELRDGELVRRVSKKIKLNKLEGSFPGILHTIEGFYSDIFKLRNNGGGESARLSYVEKEELKDAYALIESGLERKFIKMKMELPVGPILDGSWDDFSRSQLKYDLATKVLEAKKKVSRKPGGIDFNPKKINMKIDKNYDGASFSMDDIKFNNIKIDGLVPQIVRITDVKDLEAVLAPANLHTP